MSTILEAYLKHIQNDSDMENFLEKFKRKIIIRDPVQQYVGMTIFNSNDENLKNTAFVFEFDT